MLIICCSSSLQIERGLNKIISPLLRHEFHASRLALESTLRALSSHLDFSPTTNSSPISFIHPPKMSSMVDAVMSTDNNQNDPRSDATPGRRRPRSSSRPRGPPSVSTPGMHSDVDGFADDEIVGRRGMRRQMAGGTQDVPRVVDATAETLGIQFERFLDKYGQFLCVGEQY